MQDKKQKTATNKASMKRRNSYSDLGLVISLSVFVCILSKCLMFGFTWAGIVWLSLTLAYFVVSFMFPSDGKIVKHSTTAYLIISVVVACSLILFDRKATPELHAFAGTGDTIQDAQIIEEAPPVEEYVPYVPDTTAVDTTKIDTAAVHSDTQTDIPEAENAVEAAPSDTAAVN